jgi:hypothetical protein
MRDEMLKKLDNLVATIAPWGRGPLDDARCRVEWQMIRDELIAERCENCKRWYVEHNVGPWRYCPDLKIDTDPDFCCSHFESKGEIK